MKEFFFFKQLHDFSYLMRACVCVYIGKDVKKYLKNWEKTI